MFAGLQDLLNNITPEIYRNLKQSVELGKWPAGTKLSSEQVELCLQAIIAYEEKNLPIEERTAYIPTTKHAHCGSQDGAIADDEQQPLHLK